ncbi:hypothetical protein V6N13_064839 [Hibiscus sabdariffa]
MSALRTMEPLPMALLFVILPFLFLLRLVYQFRRKPYPPGPKGLPIIGNMLMMDRLTHRGLAKLAHRYGGIFHLKMGYLHMVAISNPEMARQVLQFHDNIFSNRPATIAISYLTYGRADMAFAHYGPFWRQMRKLCVVKLFSRKRAESWESVRDEVENLKRKRYVNACDGDGGGSDDDDTNMVDELLAFYSEEAKANESDDVNSIRLTRDNIKAIIMDVMFGGTETVASAIEWALSELMRSPKDMTRVQWELAEVVGLDRRMEESDLDKLPYLKCCVKETLRLHPPIPLLHHETAEETVVAGYRIPAKSRVMINAWAIGRDRDSWEDPESFKPSRFVKEGMPDFKGGDFEFIPFGSGRRSCPGMQLGLYAVELGVGQLLHCFTWELGDGMKPTELDMSDEFGLTAPRATRLYAVPKNRLLCPLF